MTLVPHTLQNLAPSLSWLPQFVHIFPAVLFKAAKFVPHEPQNLAPSGSSYPHLGQITDIKSNPFVVYFHCSLKLNSSIMSPYMSHSSPVLTTVISLISEVSFSFWSVLI